MVKAGGRAIVGHEDQNGVVRQAPGVQVGHQFAYVGVYVPDHPVDSRVLVAEPPRDVGLAELLRNQIGRVRSVRRDVGEEGLVLAIDDPFDRFVEEDVRAIAVVLLLHAVVEEDRIEVVGAGRIGRLADAAALMHEGLLEALINAAERKVVTEVPFAEDSGAVADVAQHFRDRDFGRSHQGAAKVGVDYAGAIVVAPGHQRGPGRRADRRNVESRHLDALGGQPIEVRGVEDRIAVGA